MSERFSVTLIAGRNEFFAPDVHIGSETRVEMPDGRHVTGTVHAVEVSDDGSEIKVTVEVPDGTLPKQSLSGFSLGSA